MTQSLGTWGDPDKVVFRPFDFYGQTFHTRTPSIPGLVKMKRNVRQIETRLEADELTDDEMDEVLAAFGVVLADFVGKCLTPAERDRWQALIDDPSIEVDLLDIKSVALRIAALANEDDADPLDKRQPGSTSNGVTSEAGSSSPGLTTDPIPTS